MTLNEIIEAFKADSHPETLALSPTMELANICLVYLIEDNGMLYETKVQDLVELIDREENNDLVSDLANKFDEAQIFTFEEKDSAFWDSIEDNDELLSCCANNKQHAEVLNQSIEALAQHCKNKSQPSLGM